MVNMVGKIEDIETLKNDVNELKQNMDILKGVIDLISGAKVDERLVKIENELLKYK